MKARAILVAMAVLGLTVVGRADFELHGLEELTVNTLHNTGTLYDQSNVEVVTGGFVTDLRAHDSSSVTMTDGYASFLFGLDDATVSISGGAIGLLSASHNSAVNIYGGVVTDFSGSLTGGSLNVFGGGLSNLLAGNSSIIDIYGGEMLTFSGIEHSTTTFHGQDFVLGDGLFLDGDEVLGTGALSGKWFDGTAWSVNIQQNDATAAILAIPEPATLSLLAMGGLAVMRRRRK